MLRTFPVIIALCMTSAAIPTEQIPPSPRLPKSTPWNLEQLSQPPSFEWVDDSGHVRSLFYEGEPLGGKPTRVFAYYASPATLGTTNKPDEKFPAVVLLHGGGGTAFREWAEMWAKRGYAAIAMDLAGYRPQEGKNAHDPASRERQPEGMPDQSHEEKFGKVDERITEQWPYHAVAAAIRAHSLVLSFPEVDATRSAVTGISWGGYLTNIVAGVDRRFDAAVPVYGCGFLSENSAWLVQLSSMTSGQRQRWVQLWDPSKYLPAVEAPIFFINGTNDAAYPLDSYMKSYATVPGEKLIRVTVNMPHSHPDGWAPIEIMAFVDRHLRGGPNLPTITDVKNDGGALTAKYTADGKPKAQLHFTKGKESVNKRNWETMPATIGDDNQINGRVPKEATIWFITVTDEHKNTISSEVYFEDGTLTAKR
jgi:cephalosporin-C deacetylase-like acetyl esterase